MSENAAEEVGAEVSVEIAGGSGAQLVGFGAQPAERGEPRGDLRAA